MLNRRHLLGLAGAGAGAAVLAACGGSTEADTSGSAETAGSGGSGEPTTLVVGATPVPHAEILKFVSDNLAENAGLTLEIEEFTDYKIPNRVLVEGELDANYFQHVPYLEGEIEGNGYELSHTEGVHIEPLGAYSETVTSLDDVAEGGEVGYPNDPTNGGRALALLADNGLITLAEGVEPTAATTDDIAENPKNLTFRPLEAAMIPRALGDFEIGVINGNFAIDGGLSPAEDALALESGENNPYANVMAYRTEDEGNEAIAALDELLHSEEVKQFINDTYADGSVIAAF